MGSVLITAAVLTALSLHNPDENVCTKEWHVPTHFTAQTGSYSGAFTYGIGYRLRYYTPEILLGYTPALIADEELYSLSLKNSFHYDYIQAHENVFFRPYVGTNIIFSINDSDTFIKQPKQYPDGYYPSNGIRTAPFIGVETKMDNVSVYFEFTALDHYLETYMRSDGALSIEDASTYGIGWKIDL